MNNPFCLKNRNSRGNSVKKINISIFENIKHFQKVDYALKNKALCWCIRVQLKWKRKLIGKSVYPTGAWKTLNGNDTRYMYKPVISVLVL